MPPEPELSEECKMIVPVPVAVPAEIAPPSVILPLVAEVSVVNWNVPVELTEEAVTVTEPVFLIYAEPLLAVALTLDAVVMKVEAEPIEPELDTRVTVPAVTVAPVSIKSEARVVLIE